MRMFLKKKAKFEDATPVKTPLDILLEAPGLWRMTEAERVAMTVSCRDADYIPKVKDAGSVKKVDKKRVQVLHNGVLIEADGYAGKWMTGVIKGLNGHHEPQEEKAFYEVLKKMKPGATIIELGSYWSYYSIWFKKEIKNSTAICVEPDPNNRSLGERNAELNKINDIIFLEGAAGKDYGVKVPVELDSNPGQFVDVPVLSVDGLVKKRNLSRVDILHMDVQGFELSALQGALKSIRSGKVRFVFVSTHHYLFSKSPNTHKDCLQLITNNGGHIVASHTIPESFSGDGLIIASFDDKDKNFKVDMSLNHSDQSLFRSYEDDLEILINNHNSLENNT